MFFLGTMYTDDGQYYTNNSRGGMQGLDLIQPLYLGGVPNFSLINKQSGFESGFVGEFNLICSISL